jgi:ribosome-binding factor A
MRKINELLRAVVAEEIIGLKDPGIGFVTVTSVDTSPDLRNAIVFYSVLGSDDEKAATAAALMRAAPRIQSEVGRQVRIKFTPRLAFEVDPSIEQGMKIDRLLRGLDREGTDDGS